MSLKCLISHIQKLRFSHDTAHKKQQQYFCSQLRLSLGIYPVLLNHVIRKPAFCICKNKGVDQLRSNYAVDQRLNFHNIDSAIPLLTNFKPLAIFCSYTARFVLALVKKPKDRFSQFAVGSYASSYEGGWCQG